MAVNPFFAQVIDAAEERIRAQVLKDARFREYSLEQVFRQPGANPNARRFPPNRHDPTEHGETLLEAVIHGLKDYRQTHVIGILDFLIKIGANVNVSDKSSSPLHLACILKKFQVAEYLISQGAKVTPRIIVEVLSTQDCKQFLDMFSKQVFDINVKYGIGSGETALIMALNDRHNKPNLETIQLLLSLGADPSAVYHVDDIRQTPLSHAFSNFKAKETYSTNAEEINLHRQILELLLEHTRNMVYQKYKALMKKGKMIEPKEIEELVDSLAGNCISYIREVSVSNLRDLIREKVIEPVLKELKYQMDCRAAICMGDKKRLGEKSALTFLFKGPMADYKNLIPMIFDYAEPKEFFKEVDRSEKIEEPKALYVMDISS